MSQDKSGYLSDLGYFYREKSWDRYASLEEAKAALMPHCPELFKAYDDMLMAQKIFERVLESAERDDFGEEDDRW